MLLTCRPDQSNAEIGGGKSVHPRQIFMSSAAARAGAFSRWWSDKRAHRRGVQRTPTVVTIRSDKRKKVSSLRSALKDVMAEPPPPFPRPKHWRRRDDHCPIISDSASIPPRPTQRSQVGCSSASYLPGTTCRTEDVPPQIKASLGRYHRRLVCPDSAAALRHNIGHRTEPSFVDIGTNMLIDLQHREITPEDYDTLRRKQAAKIHFCVHVSPC